MSISGPHRFGTYRTGLAALLVAAGLGCARSGSNPETPPPAMPSAMPAPGQPGASLSTARADSQMQAVLEQLALLGGKPLTTLSPAEAREQPTPADAVKALLEERGMSTAPEPVGDVENRDILGAAGNIPARIYTPAGEGPFPVIVYYHGGGWVIANLDTYDASARALTNAAQAVVVSVAYRQAPEHKFPAAHSDAFAAYRWALDNAGEINGDSMRVAVAGESAGGNLAAAVAMMARDSSVKAPVHQLLVYPIADYSMDTPSYGENANAKPLSKPLMAWFFDHYLRSPADGASPLITLVDAPNLSGLPSATVITAEIDPLRSEGKAYADRLRAAGVDVTYKNYEGVTHEFFGMGAVVDKAKEAVQVGANGLKGAFGEGMKAYQPPTQ